MRRTNRRSGVLVPLFSIPSSRSWGIGDIGDIAVFTAWLAGAGQRILQLLPLNEMAAGASSPYSALSAMAIDPIYVSLMDVADFIALGGMSSLTAEEGARLDSARRSARVQYDLIRPVKNRVLRSSFARFVACDWSAATPRASSLRNYADSEAWWLDDYALFRAVHDREDGRPWWEWPEDLRTRAPQALADARRALADEILFHQYVQWLAGQQWAAARVAAAANGVALFGDVPFMVDHHSADVWTHQASFRLDRSVGVPPDAFSADGQDWGMPAYDWPALIANGFEWLHARARRSAALFDGYRVDHLVGFYRTYSRVRSDRSQPAFLPADQPSQLRLGEAVLGVFRSAGAEVIAEDLGVIPPFVRASLALLGVPGYRVFRWERRWHEEGHPFTDPAEYPSISVATTGTHDTETLAVWWGSASLEERHAVMATPTVRRMTQRQDLAGEAFVPHVRDVLLRTLLASASHVVLLPVQDVFGWRDRINTPATVSDENWSYRLPWPSDQMDAADEARERRRQMHEWTRQFGRA